MKSAWLIPDKPKAKRKGIRISKDSVRIVLYIAALISNLFTAYIVGNNKGYREGKKVGQLEERLGWQRFADSSITLMDTLLTAAKKPTRVEIDLATGDTTRQYTTDTVRIFRLHQSLYDTLQLHRYEQSQDSNYETYKLNL